MVEIEDCNVFSAVVNPVDAESVGTVGTAQDEAGGVVAGEAV